jgi:hypothetical protein
MTKKKQKVKKHNNTSHRKAANTAAVSKEIRHLSKTWNELDRIERGDRLCSLVDQGCTARGLADDLGQSPTSILRHMKLARLPEADREAVKSGKSAKKILALKVVEDRRRRMQERLAEDARTGILSNQLADDILEFCKANPGVHGSDLDTVIQFLNEVRDSLTRLDWERVPAPKVKRSLPLKQRFRLTRPVPENDEAINAHGARWLALYLKSEAPERPIQDRAIDKAQARRTELKKVEPKKTGLQLYYDTALKFAELSASPPPRKY